MKLYERERERKREREREYLRFDIRVQKGHLHEAVTWGFTGIKTEVRITFLVLCLKQSCDIFSDASYTLSFACDTIHQFFFTSTETLFTLSGISISYLKIPSASTSKKTGSNFSSLVVGCQFHLLSGIMNGSSTSGGIPPSNGAASPATGGGRAVVVVVEVVVVGRG